VHKIQLQHLGEKEACLHIATFGDYVQTFKQTTLYYHFKKGGSLNQGLDSSEFLNVKQPKSVAQSNF
jgi:hypothetical protein